MGRKEKPDSTEFKPNERQLAILRALLDPDVPATIGAICEDAGVDRTTYWKWRQDPKFCQWLYEEYKCVVPKVMVHLDKVGMRMAAKNFQYFQFMQRKYESIPGQLEAGVEKGFQGLWDLMNQDRLKRQGNEGNASD